MRCPVRPFLFLSRSAQSTPSVPLLVSVLLAALVFSLPMPAGAQYARSATPAAESAGPASSADVRDAEATETVQIVVEACPSGGAAPADCEDHGGVTLDVQVDGADLPEGFLTTEMGSIGTNTARFDAPLDAELWVAVRDGIPDGYVYPEGSRATTVAQLPEEGCGGESTCRYLTLQLLPDPFAPPPEPGTVPPAPLETVLAVVRACEPDDEMTDDCEDLSGVTLGVSIDGEDLAGGPVTTEPGGIGTNAAAFPSPSRAMVEVVLLDGIPDGYVFAPGTFRTVVFNLPRVGCGGEATCRELTIVLTPAPLAPVPDPDQAPIIDSEASFAFAADDWSNAFEAVDADIYQRDAVAVYGAASDYPSATLTVDLDAAGDGQTALTLTGVDDESPGPNRIAISVNGVVVHDGSLGFYDWDPEASEVAWNRSTLYFPSTLLQPGENAITVENLADASAVGEPPYLLLSEAFLDVDVGGVG